MTSQSKWTFPSFVCPWFNLGCYHLIFVKNLPLRSGSIVKAWVGFGKAKCVLCWGTKGLLGTTEWKVQCIVLLMVSLDKICLKLLIINPYLYVLAMSFVPKTNLLLEIAKYNVFDHISMVLCHGLYKHYNLYLQLIIHSLCWISLLSSYCNVIVNIASYLALCWVLSMHALHSYIVDTFML